MELRQLPPQHDLAVSERGTMYSPANIVYMNKIAVGPEGKGNQAVGLTLLHVHFVDRLPPERELIKQFGYSRAVVREGLRLLEADGLIRRVKAGKLTESEANEFKAQAERYKDKLSPEAQAKFKDFIDNKMKKIEVLDLVNSNRPDPIGVHDPAVLPADKDKLEQQTVKGGKLFVDGVKGTDPRQNYIGDCYLASGISSLAASSPDVIKNAIKDNHDGTYTVRFYEGVGEGGRLFTLLKLRTMRPAESTGAGRIAVGVGGGVHERLGV